MQTTKPQILASLMNGKLISTCIRNGLPSMTFIVTNLKNIDSLMNF